MIYGKKLDNFKGEEEDDDEELFYLAKIECIMLFLLLDNLLVASLCSSGDTDLEDANPNLLFYIR